MKDIWLGIDEIPVLGYVRIGHFVTPFCLEMNTSSKYVTFLERSIPTEFQFSPAREVGITAYNHTPDKNITWAYGVFFDDISEVLKERIDDNQGTLLAARLTWTRYYDEMSDGRYLVHTGLGIAHTDDQDDETRFRARPNIHEGNYYIDTGTFTNADKYRVLGAELAAVWGPFSLQSELMWTETSTGDAGLGTQSSLDVLGFQQRGAREVQRPDRGFQLVLDSVRPLDVRVDPPVHRPNIFRRRRRPRRRASGASAFHRRLGKRYHRNSHRVQFLTVRPDHEPLQYSRPEPSDGRFGHEFRLCRRLLCAMRPRRRLPQSLSPGLRGTRN